MIMFEQSRRLSQPLRWGRREKTAVAALLSCLVLALIALGAYALTSGSPARTDCVTVTFASTLGGADLHACGARAKRVCASGDFRGIQQELSTACRRAGFAYRTPS
ncbi:MAG: hypothetical protein JWN81_2341 [Solirubrobacterales bacterium]|jgi:hypothetical protein|nr:hypothetical protein [Solirubrobacterales bacterium]